MNHMVSKFGYFVIVYALKSPFLIVLQKGQPQQMIDLIEKYNIDLSYTGVAPFSDRIERMCRKPNAFLNYKTKRVEILADKKAYEK